jgi:ribosomal protein S18 acetylase RimI-like enzyme
MLTDNGLTLRPVEAADAGALQAACWPGRPLDIIILRLEDVIRRRRNGMAWGAVAAVEGTPVAYGQLARWNHTAEISDLIVADGWRCRGIGTALIHHLLGIARQEGLPEVEIGVALCNAQALALYRRLGFEEKRRVVLQLDGGPEPALYLAMRLDGAPRTPAWQSSQP